MALTPTDVTGFMQALDAGTLEPKISQLLTHVATSVLEHGSKKINGEITLKLKFAPYGNNSEIDINGDLSFKRPNHRGGKESENYPFNSRFYVNQKGNMTEHPDTTQGDFFKKDGSKTAEGVNP